MPRRSPIRTAAVLQVILALALGLVQPWAWARPARHEQDPKALARQALEAGAAHYDGGAYAEALRSFEDAYALYPSPKLFFNFGLAHRALGNNAQAATWFRRFLADANDAEASVRAEATSLLERLRESVATLDVRTDVQGATLLIDGQDKGPLPLGQPLFLEPGRHEVAAITPSARASQTINLRAGESASVLLSPVALKDLTSVAAVEDSSMVTAPPAVTASPTAVSSPPLHARWWFWAAVGALVVGGAAAGYAIVQDEKPCGSLGCADVR